MRTSVSTIKAQNDFLAELSRLWRQHSEDGGTIDPNSALLQAREDWRPADLPDDRADYARRIITLGWIGEDLMKLIEVFEEMDALAWAGFSVTPARMEELTQEVQRFCSVRRNRSGLRSVGFGESPAAGYWLKLVRKETKMD